ncbi:MAG: division/cell wall cluster transcriptional repressor MraZ [Patescibacteria group bacterium]|nr:division/cell wall cluster transcriptional repressor MraZ [Patescibacteria group bacterium]
MLLGEYNHTLDNKGRISIPSKFRSKFLEGIIITRGLDNCLFGFTKEEWERVVKKIVNLPLSQSNARAFSRLMLAGAFETEIDNQGRILIPESLRKYANLNKKAVIVGVYTRIEIWDENNWENYKKQSEENSEEIAERLSDLGI